MKVTLNTPRQPARSDLRPLESLVWDVLARSPSDEVHLPPNFMGVPPEVLSEALANLSGMGYLTAEDVAPTPQPFRFSEDIDMRGRIRQQQDAVPTGTGVSVR